MDVDSNDLSPIHHVPPEIFREVFKFSIALDFREIPGGATLHLIRLSHVCRLWRQVILNCSALWSDICLDLSSKEPEKQAAHWLEYGGSVPLSIRIENSFQFDEEDMQVDEEGLLLRLADILRGTMDRWTSFSISVWPEQAKLFLENCKGFTSNLVELSTDLINDDSDEPLPLPIPFNLPPGFTPTHPISASSRYCIPIYGSLGASITDLDVYTGPGDVDIEDYVRMLAACPNITKCNIEGAYSHVISNPAISRQISLPHLTDLRFSGFRNVDQLINHLRSRALVSLRIFEFEWSTALGVALGTIFRICSQLVVVEIVAADEDHVEALSPPPEGSPVLPSLSRLQIDAHNSIYSLLRLLSTPHICTLDIGDVPFDSVRGLISFSTQLSSATFRKVRAAPQSTTPLFNLPALSWLTIVDSPRLLDHITAPQLQHFTLNSSNNPDGSTSTSLRDFMARSNPALRTLKFIYLDIGDDDLLWCLGRLPQVEILEVEKCPVSDAVFRALCAPSSVEISDSPLLPRLHHVRFYLNHDMTPSGAIEFFASRNGPLPPHSTKRTSVNVRGSVDFVIKHEAFWRDVNTLESLGAYFPSQTSIIAQRREKTLGKRGLAEFLVGDT
ncbi:hypothetical protein BOTBODRAFT_30474 [Botryobasidium botryosum FD-172 SS1]|uniref:F-box domain-containing protein n=1 Tax=Botryobasidium botryosum (strain FD-172 SS1) TaxID=930990 RepID=A0A067MZZ2_BOTB1|nr:hypothetical protein BOTBODRAFT_30474 [Botryobasidium botryosum FD-172 SS1]